MFNVILRRIVTWFIDSTNKLVVPTPNLGGQKMFRTKRFRVHVSLILVVVLAFSGLTAPFSYGRTEAKKSDKSKEPPDPCEQALTPPGNANGLHRRCDAIGAGGGAARGDFNGDGIADLAVGVPFEDQDGVNAVGGVNIIYGSSSGLTSTGDQFFDMASFGFTYQSNAHFGWSLAAGNFNGDNFSDLAIGMPDLDLGSDPDSGSVVVINGSSTGLDLSTESNVPSITANLRGRTGAALVWANFNGDAFDDLAVGSPNAKVPGDGFGCSRLAFDVPNAGKVEVLYGSAQGLSAFGGQVFRQGTCDFSDGVGIGDTPEEGDGFGSSLASINGNLVIGAPFEDLGLFDKQDAGMIHLLRGLSTGLDTFPTQIITQDTAGVGGGAESGDQFGRVLHGGRFFKDTDRREALAVGIPFEDVLDNTADDAGAIQVFFAGVGEDVVTVTGNMFVSQSNLPNVSSETGDRFGWAITSGDFDGDGRGDLAVGAPGENIGSISDAGIVSVLYGSANGPSTTRVQNWHQDSTGIAEVAEPGDQFGYAVSAWNFGKDSKADLAIGVPFEDLTSTVTSTLQQDAGVVHLLYGATGGLSSAGNQLWSQDSTGINDSSQVGDRFGQTLY
jgi:hypothetical protein